MVSRACILTYYIASYLCFRCWVFHYEKNTKLVRHSKYCDITGGRFFGSDSCTAALIGGIFIWLISLLSHRGCSCRYY